MLLATPTVHTQLYQIFIYGYALLKILIFRFDQNLIYVIFLQHVQQAQEEIVWPEIPQEPVPQVLVNSKHNNTYHRQR